MKRVILVLTASILLVSGVGQARADQIFATSYDMNNGGSGTFTYHDDTYSPDPSGNRFVDNAPLSGGLGKLTDGVKATFNWFNTPQVYVGWAGADQTITFHFADTVSIDDVVINVDNSNGAGGVSLPSSVTISMGGTTLNPTVPQDNNPLPRDVDFSNLGLSGNSLQLTLHHQTEWVMLSEVQFFGSAAPVPEPASLTLLGMGGAGMIGYVWRRRRHRAA